jgi:cytochrome c553
LEPARASAPSPSPSHPQTGFDTGFNIVTLSARILGCCIAAAISSVSVITTVYAQEKKISGPPPKVYSELPVICAKCHKPDGRGGPAYGGFAADLRATALDHQGLVQVIADGKRRTGMPEFKSTLTKREIEGIATYIEEHIKDVYLDAQGNRISAEEAAALDPRKNDAKAKE